MTTKLEEHSAQVGLNISREKTKVMQITQRPSPQPIAVAQVKLDYVERFTYLGSVISSDGDVVVEINTRLAKAAAVFRRLDNVWRSVEALQMTSKTVRPHLEYCVSVWSPQYVKGKMLIERIQHRFSKK